MSTSSPRDRVVRIYEDWASGNFDQALDACAEDLEVIDPGAGTVYGRGRFGYYLAMFKRAMPDGRVMIEHVADAGDTVAVEARLTGTHTGPLSTDHTEVSPTGAAVDLRFADIFRIRDGKIVSYHTYYDQLGLLRQLGVVF